MSDDKIDLPKREANGRLTAYKNFRVPINTLTVAAQMLVIHNSIKSKEEKK